MKLRISTCIAGIALLAVFAIAPVRLTSQTAQTIYKIVPLDTLGGLSGGGSGINDRGWVTGFANQQGDNVSHGALWVGGPQVIDLGALGGPGFNSAVAWPVKSNNGVVVGISDTNEDQQPADNFSCYPFFATGSPTGKVCKGFRWANGSMTALPPFPNSRLGRERCRRPDVQLCSPDPAVPSRDLGKRWHDEGTTAAARRFHERRHGDQRPWPSRWHLWSLRHRGRRRQCCPLRSLAKRRSHRNPEPWRAYVEHSYGNQ